MDYKIQKALNLGLTTIKQKTYWEMLKLKNKNKIQNNVKTSIIN